MNACAGAFFIEAHLILMLVVCDPEDVSLFMMPVNFGDPKFLDQKLQPNVFPLILLAYGDPIAVAV